jgi:hypothetical protein
VPSPPSSAARRMTSEASRGAFGGDGSRSVYGTQLFIVDRSGNTMMRRDP